MNKQEFNEYKQKMMFKDGVKLGPSMILSRSLERPIYAKHIGNENILTVGSAGSGKTRSVVIPNLLQMTGSYVVHDPEGELYCQVGEVLKEYGYKVIVFDPSGKVSTSRYNPLYYVENELDVHNLVECILQELNANDSFWRKSQETFLCACIYYLKDHCQEESRRNLKSILNMIKSGNGQKEALNKLFDSLPRDSKAYQYYQAFNQVAGRTFASIMVDLMNRFSELFDEKVTDIITTDTLDLGKLGDEKTAIFIMNNCVSPSFLVPILFSQAYIEMSKMEEKKYPVTFVLDEFPLIGMIPNIEMYMAVGRKFKTSFMITCQDLQQVKAIYGEEKTNLIIANSSTLLYLGCMDRYTEEYFEKLLEKCNLGTNDSILVKNFKKMNQNNCLVKCMNVKPMIDKKYDLRKHPLYYRLPEYKC